MKTNNKIKGHKLEQLVTLIHETLKDTTKTKVFCNYKVRSLDNRYREFDVFIQSEINKSTIQIAIECKSYKKPIGVEKIEAFDSKCRSIPTINKRVFVSESGYQEGAIAAAKRLAIELHDLTDLDSKQVLSWFPISQLGLRFSIKRFTLCVAAPESLINNIEAKYNTIYFADSPEPVSVPHLIADLVTRNANGLWNVALLTFLQNGDFSSVGKIFSYGFAIKLNPHGHINIDGTNYPVIGIDSNLEYWLVEKEAKVNAAKVFKSEEGVKANVISLSFAEESTDLIVTEDNMKMYYLNKDGTAQQFKTLFKYNPNTNTFSDFKD